MIIIYVLFMIVAFVVAILLMPSIASNYDYRRVTVPDYDQFQRTVDNYSCAIESEMGCGMAEFFKGSTNLMMGNKRRARTDFMRAKKMGKHISQRTLDLCN
jgi:hypothetical protein